MNNLTNLKEFKKVITDTKLSYSDIIKLPLFKEWFGNSQVVDEKGKPMLMYHGSSSYHKFDTFKGKHFFFSENEEFAERYANQKCIEQGIDANVFVYKVFLKCNKLFDIDTEKCYDDLYNVLPDKIEYGFAGTTFSKEEYLDRLLGNYTLEPYWDKELIDNAKFGDVLNKCRDGYCNDVFIGIDKDNNVIYIQSYLIEYLKFLNEKQIEELKKGNPVKVEGYKPYTSNKIYTGEELSAAHKSGEIDEKEKLSALNRGKINQTITPHKKTQEVQHLKKQDNWTEYELTVNVDIFEMIQKLGYDGIVMQERNAKNIVVFKPNQIKLADGSNTTFRSDSNKITEAHKIENMTKK